MKLHIEMQMDNSAFTDNEGDRGREAARILRNLAARLEDMGDLCEEAVRLRDADGKSVGMCCIEEE